MLDFNAQCFTIFNIVSEDGLVQAKKQNDDLPLYYSDHSERFLFNRRMERARKHPDDAAQIPDI
jgi:hypothetical protein